MNLVRILHSLLSIILIILLINSVWSKERSLNRNEIDNKYKWRLSDIYSSWEDWEKGLSELEVKMNEFADLKGTLSKDPLALLKALQLNDDLTMLWYRVFQYPRLLRDTDTRDQDVSAKLQRVQILNSKFSTSKSWFNPELLEIPWKTMKSWLNETPGLKPYYYNIEDLYRQQIHVLDEEKEKLLSYYNQLDGTPNAIYIELSISDVKFPEVPLSDGEKLACTNGNYSMVLATNQNQADRRAMFEAHYGVYNEKANTYAAIYNGVCQRDWAIARARNYSTTLEAALDADNVPVSVYENLIRTVKENTAPLQRYLQLRKKVLGLKEYHLYDGSISLVKSEKTYPYEQSLDLVKNAVAPLGDMYQSKLKEAIQGGWIDVYENTGKRSGAYSTSVYGVHPYMLLNYNETLDYVFTVAHELGHSIHTTLANENQPFATHDYTIFVAEVASTLNERLLLDYLLANTDDPNERIDLLTQAIRDISGTFYTQVMFADFELQVHRLVEEGRPVTSEVLSNIALDLDEAYYGDAIIHDDLYKYIWARIPHFYRTPYYVYQYATCFASSAQIYNNLTSGSEKERQVALERYLNLLKSGGSDYPMNQLLEAGVDLSKPETILGITRQMDKLVAQLEKEFEKRQ